MFRLPGRSSLAPTTAPQPPSGAIGRPGHADISARPSGGRTASGIAWSRVPSLMDCLRLSASPLWGRRCLRGYHGLPATKRCPRHCALCGKPHNLGSIESIRSLTVWYWSFLRSQTRRHASMCITAQAPACFQTPIQLESSHTRWGMVNPSSPWRPL